MDDQTESARFLDNVDSPAKWHSEKESEHRKRSSSARLILLHGSLIIFYSLLFLYATFSSRHITTNHDAVRAMIHSPASESISYTTQYFNNDKWNASVYFGEPNDEREAIWEDLLTPSTIRLTPEEMARLDRPKGIQLPDGDYLGTLNVFHDLHCLRRVTRLLYVDHYFPNITDEDKHMNLMHAQHCLDRLRQSIQCRGDVSVATYIWGKRQAIPIANFTSLHECVNWDAIYKWSYNRRVDVFEPGLLIHPIFGPAYASLGNGSFTGAVHDTAL
ncbi:hypothetical protein F5Y01DRAFT_329918 [Xylaria sp. FL0043]|nr:hypothetical protein F5Y01DRAFT_329918 [Xylaria sp. FL0043]